MAYLIGMADNALPVPGGIGAVDGSLVGMPIVTARTSALLRQPCPSTGHSPSGFRRPSAQQRTCCYDAACVARSR